MEGQARSGGTKPALKVAIENLPVEIRLMIYGEP